jgi:transposase-like protein
MRWPTGKVACPSCGSENVGFIETRKLFECRNKNVGLDHKRQFSIKVGTIFEDSPLPLKSWLLAMWMAVNCKNGVSSYEVHRAIKVTQKSAWFMLHRIRLAMQAKDGGKLGGEVEADESYIGGRARFMHKHRRDQVQRGRGASKVAVMGLLQRTSADRKSKVRLQVVKSIKRPFIQSEVRKNVEAGSTLYTDQLQSYAGLDRDYVHGVIDHAEAYVDGQVHTNGMENFWSLLKRTIKGTYVSVEPFHLFRYLDEQAYRFNERGGNDGDRFELALKSIVGKRIMFKDLTGHQGVA